MLAPPEEPASEGAPDWMVSYADMITILMSFFVVMYSMAVSKNLKNAAPMMNSLHRQFGALPASYSLPSGAAQARVTEDIAPPMSPSGDQATIGGVIYFNSETSGLDEDQRQQLQTLAKVLGGKPSKIEILARTLSRSREADEKLDENWQLAHARCNSTLRQLVSLGIDPARIRIGVAARFEPNDASGDAIHSEKNDSVEVFTLNEFAEDARAEPTNHARD